MENHLDPYWGYAVLEEDAIKEENPLKNDPLGVDDPLSRQIGGGHYKDFKVQPIEFITENKLSFAAGCVVKYICRYNKPGGKGLQDLEKIKHYVDLIIQLERW